MLELLKATPATEAVDQMFLEGALAALAAARSSALEFLSAHPGLSITDLTQELANQAHGRLSPIGFVMAIYREAAQKGAVRDVAKDLLIREIREEFASGWSSGGDIGPSVRIGSWSFHIKRYVLDARAGGYAEAIVHRLAVDHPPPEGWKPEPENDPLINGLFDRCWPQERGS
jgi:hypothetical protein